MAKTKGRTKEAAKGAAASFEGDIEVVMGGFGGQGIILSGLILGKAATLFSGKHSAFTQSYGPEARGGACAANVIISETEIDYPYVTEPHYMVIMSQGAYERYVPELRPGGKLLIDEDLVTIKHPRDDVKTFSIPSTRMAEQLGRKIVANIVMLGFITAVTEVVDYDAMKSAILDSVPPGTEELNLKAYNTGYEHGAKALEAHRKQAKG
jgi:2-oxoglutarate ferredoxin oxidoreductase subunit gamma